MGGTQFYDNTMRQGAQWLLDRGVRPNHLTFLQVPFFAAQLWAARTGHPWLFVALIFVVMLLDGADGTLARTGGLQSRQGAVLDSTFDTLGIAVVLWGAALFYPFAETWLFGLFIANALLFLQNAVMEHKAVSYVRGPIILAVAWPPFLLGGLLVASIIVAWMLVFRAPAMWQAMRQM